MFNFEFHIQYRKFRSYVRSSYTVSKVPSGLIVAKNFLDFTGMPIHLNSRHHQDSFSDQCSM
jgi:hypothetical protein